MAPYGVYATSNFIDFFLLKPTIAAFNSAVTAVSVSIMAERGRKPASKAWEMFSSALKTNLGAPDTAVYTEPTATPEPVDTESAAATGDDDEVKSKISSQQPSFASGTSDVNTHTFRLRFEAIKNSTVECLEKYPQITMATVVYFVTSILGIRVQESDIEHFLESYEKNSSKLFDFLDLYWNYYSYDLLDKLIQRLAANENFESVTKQMEEYKEDMEIFREDTDMEEMFQGEFLSFDEFYALPKGSEKRFLTIACPFIQTLQDLEGVREYLANESSISECALLLKSIGDEFVITWCQIPTDTIDKTAAIAFTGTGRCLSEEIVEEEDVQLVDNNEQKQTSEDVCSSIVAEIVDYVDFRLIRQQFRKYDIPSDVIINVMPRESGGKICFKPSIDEVQQMLKKLSKIEHGCQTFYRSLRDTEHVNRKHKVVADIIQKKSLQKVYSCPIESSFQCTSGSSFTYTGRKKDIIWKEAGISLFFPDAGHKTRIKFSIKLVNDDYTLPPDNSDMELVSAAYQISATDTLPKPVRIVMEHCVFLEEENTLQFMVAHGEPPYQFNPLPGGRFPLNKFYGEIEMAKFSILSIFKRGHSIVQFAVNIYCRDSSANFIVTKDLNPNIMAVKTEYCAGNKLIDFIMKCHSSTKAITLSLPQAKENGWVVKPVVDPPSIDMDIIKKYRPGRTIPKIVLKMTWKGTGQPIDDTVTVLINGENVKSFDLPCASSCTPLHTPMSSRFSCQESANDFTDLPQQIPCHQDQLYPQPTLVPGVVGPQLKDLTQALKSLPWSDVSNMAIQLAVPYKVIQNIEEQYHDPSRRLPAVMDEWLISDPKASWKKIVKSLKDIGKNVLANEIEQSRVLTGDEH